MSEREERDSEESESVIGGERESNRRRWKKKEESKGESRSLGGNERSEASERTKAREIGKRGHWLFVAGSTYGNRYGPTIAVGMRSFFSFLCLPIPGELLSLRGGGGGGGEPLAGNPVGRRPVEPTWCTRGSVLQAGEGSSSIPRER